MTQVESRKQNISDSDSDTHRMFPPMFIELLFGLARAAALGARVGPLAPVIHQMLF